MFVFSLERGTMMNVKERIQRSRGERGNALFLILIAVALFAALSYAITQSGRGSGNVDRETVAILAGQIVEQPAAVRTAVTRMIITGIDESAITFTGDTDEFDVFDIANGGGGATDVPPPPNACVTPPCADWTYIPAADTDSGHYIVGVGTVSTEAIAFLGDVTSQVCSQILKGLGLTTTPVAQKTVDYNEAGAAAAYDAAGSAVTIKSTDNSLDGQAFACWDQDKDAGGEYAYYHALIEQ